MLLFSIIVLYLFMENIEMNIGFFFYRLLSMDNLLNNQTEPIDELNSQSGEDAVDPRIQVGGIFF